MLSRATLWGVAEVATTGSLMARCLADESISRRSIGAFEFPLGVYPVETMTPKEGYSAEFEPADTDEGDSDLDAWPDRYVYDIVVRSSRLESLWMQVLAMMPGRIYPILDYIGHDAYREIDPYIAYEPVGQERMINMLQRFHDFFYEDGMVGFGAVSEEPFFYAFVDEHKILTLRVEPELQTRVERLLEAFGLSPVDEPAGADAAAHEHRSVLLTPEDRPDLLSPEEIVERARDEWGLVLNVDPESNVDDDGNDLGITPWRCLVRIETNDRELSRYAEVICTAGCLRHAEEMALDASDQLLESNQENPEESELILIAADRVHPEQMVVEIQGESGSKSLPDKYLDQSSVLMTRWVSSTGDLAK